MASRSCWLRFPPITLSAATRDRRHRQDDELCAGQMSAPGQGQMSAAGRDQKSAFPSATNPPSEASIRMWVAGLARRAAIGTVGVAGGQGGDRRTGARRTRVSPVSPFGPCGPCGPFGLPVIAVLVAGPLVRSPLVCMKHLDMPADLPSGCEKSASQRPMLPLWVSFAALWVSFAAGPGRIANRRRPSSRTSRPGRSRHSRWLPGK
jgi:hypothetical protein